MIYQAKEFVLKDGQRVVFKTPEVSDAYELLNNIISVIKTTDNLLSTEIDFASYLKDIKKEEDFIASLREGNNYLIAVYDNNHIVGSCSLDFKNLIKVKHRAVIGIAIQKPYWDKGIGSLLFDEMINIAKQTEGIEQIELDVIATNDRAKHLYAKKGFVKTGEIPRQLKLADGSYLNGETMVLFLNK